MMGFGSYGGSAHGGGSSNLSALAPPFTVDRSTTKPTANPLVDLGEPLNWVDTNPYTFNSPQPAQFPQLDLDPIPTPSYNQNSDLFEPKTYYPSYVSPSLHVPPFNEQNLSGLDHTAQWGGGLWDWEKGKPAQLGGSFYSKETNVAPSSIYADHINLGAHPSKSLKTCEETSQNIYSLGREEQVGPPSIEKLDYNPVLGQNLSYMPMDYLKTSVMGSSSALPEADMQVPPLNLVNCKNNQVPFGTPYEKPVKQHGTTPSDSIPAMNSSPAIVIRPPAVDACPSASNTVSFKNVNPGINETDTNLTGNNPSNVEEPHYLLNSGSKYEFDPSQLSFHLGGNCYLSGESSATETEKRSTSNMTFKDASDHLFRAKSGVTLSHISPDNCSLALDNSEPVDAVENSLESLDHYNPPVDSPCWRGAPASQNSPFGSSEPVSVQLLKKLDAWDGSNGQALKFIPINSANVVKLPSAKPSEIRMTVENGNVEDSSVSSLKLPSVSIPSCREHQPGAGKAGSYHKKTSSACEMKSSDDASEQQKDYVFFNKSLDEVEKPSCTIQHSLTEGRFASKNLHISETGVADLEMMTNDVSGCRSSHMSCHAVKNLSSLPSSVENVSTKHSKCVGKEPVSNSRISVLVDTMHNLSELLLYHCSNETCELKEEDLKSLEKVINNLDACMSKNIGLESVFGELHEGTSKGRPQVAASDVLNQHVQEKRNHSGKKDERCSDFVSVKSGTDIKVKNDKMTQAIKKVLIENFHEKEEAHPQVLLYKNLWLEAEAALCSINCMARFNNMKVEIEKCKLESEKDLSEDAPDEDKIWNKKLTAVAESGPTSAVSNQNSPIKSSSYHTDDITARFHVLKQRLNDSNSVHTGDLDELSSSKLSWDLNEVDKLATEVKDSSTPGLPSLNSPVPGTASRTDDVEASVMARFDILKNRGVDDLDSNEMESKLLPEVVDVGFAGKRKQKPIDKDTAEDGISGVNLELVSQHQLANHAGEQLVVKDFHLCVQPDCTIHPPGGTRPGNQLSAGWYDSFSSDWEHVLKEELSGQNS
ncbi:uncharacterized protein LOC111289481 isoform X2 [Durio zibethinus]|uniref:Uncharacterized protein LOC111289481 isoform X2 n=1 Tax=Durio zibethinus TaxID=66656 RepID=A0A6P5Y793_DURZI|nr:uncharacterized protein LOC111289481 isoform X2 [Durio zibethinus]XP_022736301.1 uncharacterized protein LOC111289481 isoform X2 [Durio zibethinus]